MHRFDGIDWRQIYLSAAIWCGHFYSAADKPLVIFTSLFVDFFFFIPFEVGFVDENWHEHHNELNTYGYNVAPELDV